MVEVPGPELGGGIAQRNGEAVASVGCAMQGCSIDDKLWVRTPGSAIAKPSTLASPLRAECGQAGQQERTLNMAAAWPDGLVAGERIVKFNRGCRKYHHKVGRLSACAQPLADYGFLAVHRLRSIKYVSRLNMEVVFRKTNKDFVCFAVAVADGLMG